MCFALVLVGQKPKKRLSLLKIVWYNYYRKGWMINMANTARKNTVKKTNTGSTGKTSSATKKKTTVKKTDAVVLEKEVKEPVLEKEVKKPDLDKTSKASIDYKMILIIVLAFLVLVLGIAKISGVLEKKDYGKSYLVSKKVVKGNVDKDSIGSVINQDESFILVTQLESEEEYNLEKSLRKIITDNDIKDRFYVYEYEDGDNIQSMFKLNDANIKLPTILYYRDGKFVDLVSRYDEKMIEAADFAKMLDIYEITKE